MSMSRFEIHPCPFETRPCDNFGCRNVIGYKKYFLGRPDANVPKPIYCEACIRHMLHNLPTEMVDGGTDLETRLRAEITAEYDRQLEIRLQEERRQIAASYQRAAEREQQEPIIEATTTTEQADENTGEDDLTVFRCLDCGLEAKSASGLASHMRAAHRERQ